MTQTDHKVVFTVNSLTQTDPKVAWSVVWVQVLGYVGLKCLQGSGFSGGILNGLRSFLWIRVQQYTNRLVQVCSVRKDLFNILSWNSPTKNMRFTGSASFHTVEVISIPYMYF